MTYPAQMTFLLAFAIGALAAATVAVAGTPDTNPTVPAVQVGG